MNYQFLDKRMKTAFSLLALIVTAGLAHAGGFGGPPPFTNGSPLRTGTDGFYQATVRGNNVSGVLRFRYSGGQQTTSTSENFFTLFVEGQVYTGDLQANVNESSVGGVLDNSSSVNSASASGYFNGKMDLTAPDAAFSGKGSVTVVNGTETTDVTAVTVTVSPDGTTTTTTTVTDSSTDIDVSAVKSFQFNGVRNYDISDT